VEAVTSDAGPRSRHPHPFVFFVLVIPYGASFGYVSVALPFLATQIHHVDAAAAAAVVAWAFVPHGYKFLWAPIVDTTLGRKRWYVISLALTIAGTVVSTAMPIAPQTLPALTWVIVGAQIGLTLMGMTLDALMAITMPDSVKGRAAGWYQAGTFVGLGLGGWFALKLAGTFTQHPWVTGAVLGATMTLCALPLLALPSIPRDQEHAPKLGRAFADLGRDLWRLVTSASGVTGLIICLSPVGAGALGNVLGGLPDRWGLGLDYHSDFLGMQFNSADVVGIVTGLFGGMVSALGCMLGGYLADRMSRRLCYALAGAMTALSAVAMWLAPRTPWAYVVFSLLYGFFNGLAFAAFSAFVLETIGRGAAATKYTIFASLANLAITYMTHADRHGLARWGPGGALLTDAVLTFAGIVVLLAMVVVARRFSRPAVAAAA
jgi:MFS transporter, PAT family, beta-lactamase induction signal transducer AmpG